MPTAGLDYVAPAVRTMRNFFGRFGTVGASFRGIANFITPVAVVDRYRDDSEGSIFSLTATSNTAAGSQAALAFGSVTDDWELHAASWSVFTPIQPPVTRRYNMMIYTPDFTFIPVVTPAPVGFFVPGLNPDFAFTLGSVTGIAGHNPTLPSRFGRLPFQSLFLSSTSTTGPSGSAQFREARFDPPIRVYRDVTLGFTVLEPAANAIDNTVSISYAIRPRTTAGPRTG